MPTPAIQRDTARLRQLANAVNLNVLHDECSSWLAGVGDFAKLSARMGRESGRRFRLRGPGRTATLTAGVGLADLCSGGLPTCVDLGFLKSVFGFSTGLGPIVFNLSN